MDLRESVWCIVNMFFTCRHPAQAGVQSVWVAENKLDSRLRGNDGFRSEPVRILLTKFRAGINPAPTT
jgi:hypothetical protein